MSSHTKGIPFAFFCSLLREISQIKPRSTASRKSITTTATYPALETFRRWVKKLREHYSPLPSGTTSACFRLLFPDEDTRRKYEIKESRLVGQLSEILGLPRESLDNWNSEDASGCLGREVMRLLESKSSDGDEAESPFTIAEVDELLDELASTSSYSDAHIRKKYPVRRRRKDILKSLFRRLPPQEAAFMTHIILKDLQPILYPCPDINCTVSLLDFNTKAVKMLSIEHAMTVWDPSNYMSKLYRIKPTLDDTTAAFELPKHSGLPSQPIIGSMIQLPKSVKGTGCRNALSRFQNFATVWAETKYDGERAQIHVEILEDGSPKIKIFSKSKRDSTWDRVALHGIIREALGFDGGCLGTRLRKFKKNIVLDSELVAWHKDQIDEFWRIDGLIKQTGSGARARRGWKAVLKEADTEDEVNDSQLSAMTDESESTGRHLGLVFFDILVLDSDPVLFQAYSTRRQLLEQLIKPIPNKAIFSARYKIDMSEPDPCETLQVIFAEHVANHQEGLVLKADESEYNDHQLPWIKLKKDYIKGFGDCVDLVIVAAGWDRDRARSLRVTPNVYTTFWVGAISNTRDVQAKPHTKPHILVYFTVSYGLDRKQLEDFNFRVRSGNNIPFPVAEEDYRSLPFTFTLSTHLTNKPQTIIRSPFLAELLCAGFSKGQGSRFYEPRFPRIEKIYRRQERPWTECMDITELDRIARNCVGKDRRAKDIHDWCNSLWGKPTSPSIRSKRQDRVHEIREVLTGLDGTLRDQKRPYKRRRLNHDEQKNALNTNSNTTSGHQPLKISEIPSCHDLETPSLPLNPIHNIPTHIPTPEQASSISHSVLNGAFVSCFAQSNEHRNCHDCSRWKSAMTKERRVHSLESLLIACGTGRGLSSIKRGLIFVHRSDNATAANVMRKIEGRRNGMRAEIIVFECSSEELAYSNALFVT